MFKRYRRQAVLAAFVSILMMVEWLGFMGLSHKAERPYGRYTSREFLDRTEMLCWQLAPEAEIRRLHSSKVEYGKRPLWLIACTDKAGEYAGEFTWDAETGELVRVAYHCAKTAPSGGVCLSKQGAIDRSIRWMDILGMRLPGTQWRLATAPELDSRNWHLVWKSGGRTLSMLVSADRGDLVLASVWRLQQTGQ